MACGLAKKAPLHRDKNSVGADALLAEMYATSVASAGPSDTYAFITSNYQDFYVAWRPKQPHGRPRRHVRAGTLDLLV